VLPDFAIGHPISLIGLLKKPHLGHFLGKRFDELPLGRRYALPGVFSDDHLRNLEK
jgi:hypothetical protein